MADLVIKINGDVKSFRDALSDAKKSTEDLSEGLSEVAKISGVAFAALTAEIGISISKFAESEKMSRQLGLAMQNQGVYSKALQQTYLDQAAALQTLTGIDDERIVKVQTILQGMVGQTVVTKEMTKAVLDLAAAKDIDIQTSAELVGKGIEGMTMGLRRFGIEIDQNLSKQERMQQILQKINVAFGGQAEAAVQGVNGIAKLHAAFDDLQEAIGARFAPAYEKVVDLMTQFFQQASKNEAFVNLISGLLGAAAAMTGLVAGLAAVGVALTTASAIAAAFGVTLAVALGPIALIAAGVTALGAAVGYYVSQSTKAVDATKDLQGKISEQEATVAKLQARFNDPGQRIWYHTTQADIDAAKAKLLEYQNQLQATQAQENKKAAAPEQDPAKAQAAAKAEAERNAREQRHLATVRANNDVIRLETEKASQEVIDLKKKEADELAKIEDEKNKNIRGLLQKQLDETRKLEADAMQTQLQQQKSLQNDVLASNEEFQKLSQDQKEIFKAKNSQQLQSQILTEKTAAQQAALDRANKQIQDNNTFLLNQQKFGTAYALIYKMMNSDIYKGMSNAAGDLAQLQTSSNSTLKAIGKGAAIANIIIKTAESAMNIYAGFSTIPFIGPALGVAGAAAAVAFGAEQVGQVTGAAQGGILTGGIPGKDSIPVLGMPGEIVAPTQNFEEVIGSVRAAREAEKVQDKYGMGGGGASELVISLKDDLMDFIEAKLIERKNLRISLQGV